MILKIRLQAALAVCALAALAANGANAHGLDDLDDSADIYPVAQEIAEGSGFYSYDAQEPSYSGSVASVPAFNSLPGAHAKLFLDFDGVDFGSTRWGGKLPGQRPAFDIDGDTSTFSAEEQSRIEQVWSRVAEAYSMFNINVTTEDPGNYNRLESAHVVISGSNSWWGGGGGVAYVNAFSSNSSPAMARRTSWAFPQQLRVSAPGDPKTIADASIHEAGHMFGLNHQSTYNDAFTRTAVYDNNSGSTTRAPILGVAYNARRGLWAVGAAGNANFVVDELSVIGRSSNGFGFLPDEPGVSFATAEPISLSTTPLRGVIERSDDVDYYQFDLALDSDVSLLVDVAPFGPMLDAKLTIFNSDMVLVYEDDPTLTTSRESLTASFDGRLDAGTYFVSVTSHGGYAYDNGPHDRFLEDTGQYFLSGAAIAYAPEPAAVFLMACGLAWAPVRRRRRC